MNEEQTRGEKLGEVLFQVMMQLNVLGSLLMALGALVLLYPFIRLMFIPSWSDGLVWAWQAFHGLWVRGVVLLLVGAVIRMVLGAIFKKLNAIAKEMGF